MHQSIILTPKELADLIRDAAREAAQEVLRQMRPSQDDGGLWDAEQVAEYLGVSAYTVAYKLAYTRGFPAALRLGDGRKARRRWKAAEIKEWAEARQDRTGQ